MTRPEIGSEAAERAAVESGRAPEEIDRYETGAPACYGCLSVSCSDCAAYEFDHIPAEVHDPSF